MTKFRNRLLIFFVINCIVMGILIARLYYIQVIWKDELTEMARNQQNKNIPIPAKRGEILDRNGDKLAFSIKTYSVWVRTSDIKNPKDTATLIAETIKSDADEIHQRIVGSKTLFVRVARDLDKTQGDLIKGRKIKGVSITEDNKRIYPYDYLASHLIGNVNADNDGFTGIELVMNDILKGKEGKYFVTTDVHGRQLPYGEDTLLPPENGQNIVLTIDDTIQYFVEERLEAAMERHNAISATAIVMDPMTGEILAMASKPDFNLNTPRNVSRYMDENEFEALSSEDKTKIWNQMWRNISVGNTYEPGSIFKVIVSAVALDKELVNFNTKYVCRGTVRVSGIPLKCWIFPRSHGEETFLEGLMNSCNAVSVETIQKIGTNAYYEYLEAFGFFEKTGITLPAEAGPIYIQRDKVGPVELATMSYGHGINVNMIQVVRAISAIVNGGYLLEPKIVKEIVDENGTVTMIFPRKEVRQVISENTSEKMKIMLEAVVKSGTGRNAAIDGVRVGGKSGSSVKFRDGEYRLDEVVSSFVGIAPINNPKFVVYVVVDEPKGDVTGGLVAAPIVKEILSDIMRYEGITPEIAQKKIIKAPNLVGMTYQDAVIQLDKLKLKYSTDPIVVENPLSIVKGQFPEAGSDMFDDVFIILSLGDDLDE